MIPTYIAAPYHPFPGDASPFWNITRADALAKHALQTGRAPIVIHRSILAGVYGNDDDADERARGIEAACTLAAAVAVAGGELWLLVLPEGGLSAGCQREAEAYERAGGTKVRWFGMDAGYRVREIV